VATSLRLHRGGYGPGKGWISRFAGWLAATKKVTIGIRARWAPNAEASRYVQQTPSSLVLGWQEWLALPELGLLALKAKIDTGAKTSALHTHAIEPFGPSTRPMVRFTVRPDPECADIEIPVAAPIIDRRAVTSSSGEREQRFVILTRMQMGAHAWPIEVTLTNREKMTHRMLLGRQAIRPNVLVDPDATFRQPRLSYTLYGA
jgi:ribosomal protein S6--L-glutamate ligase